MIQEHAECDARFGGAPGLGDHIDIVGLVIQVAQKLCGIIGGEVMAEKENAGLALLLREERRQGIQNGAGAEITAADAHHHQTVGVLDFCGGIANFLHFHRVILARQFDPAGVFAARTGAAAQ